METFLAQIKLDLLPDDLSQEELSQVDKYIQKVPTKLLNHCEHSPDVTCPDCPKSFELVKRQPSEPIVAKSMEPSQESELVLVNIENNNPVLPVTIDENVHGPKCISTDSTQVVSLNLSFKKKKFRKRKNKFPTEEPNDSSSDKFSTPPRKSRKKKRINYKSLNPILTLIQNLKNWGEKLDHLIVVTQETKSLIKFAQSTVQAEIDLFQDDLKWDQELVEENSAKHIEEKIFDRVDKENKAKECLDPEETQKIPIHVEENESDHQEERDNAEDLEGVEEEEPDGEEDITEDVVEEDDDDQSDVENRVDLEVIQEPPQHTISSKEESDHQVPEQNDLLSEQTRPTVHSEPILQSENLEVQPLEQKEDIVTNKICIQEEPLTIQEPIETKSPILATQIQLDEEQESEECDICLLELHDGTTLYPLEKCAHVFHLECVAKCISSRGIQKKCIKCFTDISKKEEKNITNLYKFEVRNKRKEKRMKKSL